MGNYMNKTALLVLGFLLLTAACRITKSAGGHTAMLAPEEVLQRVHEAQFHYSTLLARARIEYETPEKKQSFKGSIRVIRDSAVWMSIAPAFGVELARVLITRDSIRFLDRVHKQYAIEPIENAEAVYKAPLDFALVESLISGNLAFGEMNVESMTMDSSFYYLELRSEEFLIQMRIRGGSFLIDALNVRQKEPPRLLTVDYLDYSPVDSQYFSKRRKIRLEAESTINLWLEFSSVKVDQKVNIVFVVPQKYERIH